MAEAVIGSFISGKCFKVGPLGRWGKKEVAWEVLLRETWHPGLWGNTGSQFVESAGDEHKVAVSGCAGHSTSEEQRWLLISSE